MEYAVVESKFIFSLIEAVNEKMREGWVATGGIAVVNYGVSKVYMQALTHKTKEEDVKP